MKIIICGAGGVGSSIAKQLVAQKNDVSVIDQSQDRVNKISEELDIQTIQGHASHPNALESAGAKDADMIIAVTLHDEVNITACQISQKLFSIPRKIARIRDQEYLNPAWSNLFNHDNIPIDVIISPEVEVAKSLGRQIEAPGAFDIVPFANDSVALLGISIDEKCSVINTKLRELTKKYRQDTKAIVVGINRNSKLIFPNADSDMQPNDEVYLIVDKKSVQRTLQIFGYEYQDTRRVLIIGGGNVGCSLARELSKKNLDLKIEIIEGNKDRARHIADILDSDIMVIQGDGIDQEILNEANVKEIDTVFALTNNDEVNILASFLAKRAGARRCVSLVNNNNYFQLKKPLGIDSMIDPKMITVSTVLKNIHKGKIDSVYTLKEGEAEVIEAEALKSSPLIGESLKDANLPDGIVIGALVKKNHEVISPTGNTAIEEGDHVVFLTATTKLKEVEKLFRVSAHY